MQATCYRADLPSLISRLCDNDLLSRYLNHLEADMPGCGDAALLRQLRQHLAQARMLQQEGLEHRSAVDRGSLDALLCDMFAVATWFDWDLPIEMDGVEDLPLEPLPRGLLGADESVNSALLFLLPDGRLALCRDRKADHQGDMSEHWQAEGHGH